MTDDSQTDPLDADSTDSETAAATDATDVSETPADGNAPEGGASDEGAPEDAVGAEASDADGETPDEEESGPDRLRQYVQRAILGALFLFALVAAFRFYFAASNAVSYWVAAPYQSAFQAAFNLVVLFVVGAGILRQLRRMR